MLKPPDRKPQPSQRPSHREAQEAWWKAIARMGQLGLPWK